uniref:NADH-ubiquinone oxidoreductase chain 2 n=1 Tax=Geukensia demissa TaxID=27807 RepID=A0A6B9VN87_GEUDE|nr:NADH dehydrogenase subunit 2 [Geukensia demissa]QHO63843.1 NADH dehydrogenase subunit 2 [Geukensia demissa]UJM44211.1 NADH dehydrogenase subunit 2 [Geukensia demissa]
MILVITPLMFISFVIVILGSIVSISSGSWLGIWLGMEINLIGFILLMNPEGMCVVEPCIKYFVVQSLGSAFILMGFICNESNMSMYLNYSLLMLGLLMKSGVFPFHGWVPSVVNSSSWFVSCMVLTWQKLAPLVFLGYIYHGVSLLISVAMMALIGGVGGLNQHSVRGLMAYSSFVHTSWMLIALFSSFFIFIIYWLVYSMSVGLVMWACAKKNKFYFKSGLRVVEVSLGIFMLSGLPPFVGFLCKILVFLSVQNVSIFFCILGSLISLKFYLSFLYNIFFGSVQNSYYLSPLSYSCVLLLIYLNIIAFVLLGLWFFFSI